MNTSIEALLLDQSLVEGAKQQLKQVTTCQHIETIFEEYRLLLDTLDNTGILYTQLRAELQKDDELNAHLLIVRVAHGLIATAGYYQEELAKVAKSQAESVKRKEQIKALQARPQTEEIKAQLDKLLLQETKTIKEVKISWAERAWSRHHTDFPDVVHKALQHIKTYNYPVWQQLQILEKVCQNSKRVNGVHKEEGED